MKLARWENSTLKFSPKILEFDRIGSQHHSGGDMDTLAAKVRKVKHAFAITSFVILLLVGHFLFIQKPLMGLQLSSFFLITLPGIIFCATVEDYLNDIRKGAMEKAAAQGD